MRRSRINGRGRPRPYVARKPIGAGSEFDERAVAGAAGNKVHGEILEADAQLKQARSQLGDLRGRIDYEVRSALLDLTAAAQQVEVARSSVELAEQAFTQSQDRFAAGVADNLEVVQAQESVAGAHETYIQSLYAHNLAKVELAYAIGDAEDGVKRFLKSNQ